MDMAHNIRTATNYIKKFIKSKPEIGIILGSGLGALGEEIKEACIISYKDIPYFPVSTVEGHIGELVIGKLENKNVIAMRGRFHYYEGYSMEEVTFPIKVMTLLGIDILIVTNAAGGVNYDFIPGDLMIINDHINFSLINPLIGPNDENFGPRFPDMSSAYCKELIKKSEEVAEKLKLNVKKGVYAFLTGPTYETPAEIKALSRLGADAVGMSTVPEVIIAVHGDIKVLGISCISNMAAGILNKPLNHDEVISTAKKIEEKFINYIKEIIKNL
ncbi:MAG: purine-nucleoside phosphorylase [Clostridiales bacterium]|nr:purine-nucleoside phosphorylase [Clostridiales bacterium]